MNTIYKFGVIYFLSSLMGAGVFAVSSSADAPGPGPCAGDIQKFCSDIQPGGGAVLQCLKAHQANLSDACKQAGEELKQKILSFAAACEADSEKYCKDIQPGGGRKIKCLKDNLANLSPDCKTQVAHIHGGGVRIQPAGTSSQPPAPAPGNSDDDH